MKYDTDKLRSFASAVMQKNGLNQEDSDLFAESLISADMRGISSHGLTRLKTYAYRLHAGLVDAKAEPEILADMPALLLVDGKNGLGVPTAMKVMRLCVERAKKSGACFAAVRGGNHFGIGQFYTDYAAQNGMIGLAVTNGPAAIAPTGGKKAILGTNPLAVSVPSGKYPDVDLDMATSVVARGKVTLAKKNGESIPLGWGIDAEGRPTTDPAKVSCMLPVGGPKGYGLGLLIELLCSGLAGAGSGLTMGSFYDLSGTTQNVGYFLGAIHISAIESLTEFEARADAILDTLKESPKVEGCKEIFLPGEIERNRAAVAESEGISLKAAVEAELKEVAETYGVEFDCV